MTDLLAGTKVTALDTPVTVSSAQAPSYSTTGTIYGTSSSAGSYADCAVVFVAPTTGRVRITTTARLVNASTSGSLLAPETRTGSTIGSGTVVEAADDSNGCSHYGTNFSRLSATHLLSGLTPGATYNTRLLARTVSASNAASFALRELIVEPAT